MYTVYIIQSLDSEQYYVGMTADLERRLFEHNSGQVRSTQKKAPLKVIHCEQFADKSDALKREHQIKSYKGGEAFLKIVHRHGTRVA